MLTLSPAVRIYLKAGATDLLPSIDGLAALVREEISPDERLRCAGRMRGVGCSHAREEGRFG